MRIDTARSQALVGFCRANHAETTNLRTQIENAFCTITLGALDDRPIARSRRLLLTAAARVANSNMRWDAGRHTLDSWGKPPACIETVHGSVVLRGLGPATAVTAQPLDGAGARWDRRFGAKRPRTAGSWRSAARPPLGTGSRWIRAGESSTTGCQRACNEHQKGTTKHTKHTKKGGRSMARIWKAML